MAAHQKHTDEDYIFLSKSDQDRLFKDEPVYHKVID